ncbi:MAG: UDP-N-acetylmuramoyl-tripeptide--D-alanyl-D-alanine ligase [Nitrospirae bacterium]|nr:MAG: UDP-N-acetylmuramoyl-tripeptide--D-alanyl-D-alanine ligase [Nitrospirota bacterium]
MHNRVIYTLNEIVEATGGRLLLKGADLFTGLSIDSRTIRDGELFIALKGERFDGHDFLGQALQRANGALVSYPPTIPQRGKSIIYVSNTLKALQAIARHRRASRNVKVIGITGTNGKTTTKEMIGAILKKRFSVLLSSGNLNNQIGMPLSLSGLNGQEIAVLEFGASQPGDIDELCRISSPDVGVITNIGPGHIAGFGSLEMVRDTKLEIAGYADILVLNSDDRLLRERIETLKERGKRVVTFGLEEQANYRAVDIKRTEESISFKVVGGEYGKIDLELPLIGLFNVYNALAAVSVAGLFSIDAGLVSEAIGAFRGVPMRVERREFKGALLISDLYNANPASMEEALKELASLRKKRAIAVLGDMLELGAYEETAHRKIGRLVAELPVDVLITVGQRMAYAGEEFQQNTNGSRLHFHASEVDEAKRLLEGLVREDDTVLVKGSRGMKLERILEE